LWYWSNEILSNIPTLNNSFDFVFWMETNVGLEFSGTIFCIGWRIRGYFLMIYKFIIKLLKPLLKWKNLSSYRKFNSVQKQPNLYSTLILSMPLCNTVSEGGLGHFNNFFNFYIWQQKMCCFDLQLYFRISWSARHK
jgi:hypothetical protein